MATKRLESGLVVPSTYVEPEKTEKPAPPPDPDAGIRMSKVVALRNVQAAPGTTRAILNNGYSFTVKKDGMVRIYDGNRKQRRRKQFSKGA